MGHYYDRQGNPCHYVGNRASTLRDARSNEWVPSVTEILSILAKPALVQWQIRQGILAALTMPKDETEPEDAYLRRIMQDGRQEAQQAAAEGTAIHAAIEASFAGRRYEKRLAPHVSGVHQMLSDNFHGVTDWVIEKPFASRLGFGGCIDIHSPSIRAVGDHKGTSIGPYDDKRLAYEQHYQLGGYSLGLDFPDDCIGFNLFVSRTHPGHVRFHQWTPEKMLEGRRVFACALELWKQVKNYDGGWQA